MIMYAMDQSYCMTFFLGIWDQLQSYEPTEQRVQHGNIGQETEITGYEVAQAKSSGHSSYGSFARRKKSSTDSPGNTMTSMPTTAKEDSQQRSHSIVTNVLINAKNIMQDGVHLEQKEYQDEPRVIDESNIQIYDNRTSDASHRGDIEPRMAETNSQPQKSISAELRLSSEGESPAIASSQIQSSREVAIEQQKRSFTHHSMPDVVDPIAPANSDQTSGSGSPRQTITEHANMSLEDNQKQERVEHSQSSTAPPAQSETGSEPPQAVIKQDSGSKFEGSNSYNTEFSN